MSKYSLDEALKVAVAQANAWRDENASLRVEVQEWKGKASDAQQLANTHYDGKVRYRDRWAQAMGVVRGLASCDPVYGPVRWPEPRKNPLDFDEKPVYTSRRICALCRRKSADNCENVTHTPDCPWLPARALSAKPEPCGEKP